MKRAFCAILATIILLLCLSGGAAAGASAIGGSEGETVRVAVLNHKNYLAFRNGKTFGYVNQYLEDIRQFTGWNYEFVEMTLLEASKALTNGEIDLLPGVQYTDERARVWDFSKRDMGESGTVLCVKLDDDRYAYNDYENFDGMRIGAIKGSIRVEQTRNKLAEYGASVDILLYDTESDVLEALDNGEVDASALSSVACVSDYKILARINSALLYFATNSRRPELKAELDEAMEAIHMEEPYYEADLTKKYYGNIKSRSALSREEQEYVDSQGVITVAVSDDMTPMEYYDGTTKTFRGIVTDVLDVVSDYSGLSFQYVSRKDVATINKQLQSGEVQIVGEIAYADGFETPLDVTLTDPYFANFVSLVTSKDKLKGANSKGTMILKEGYPFFDWVAENHGYSYIRHTDSFEACLDAIAEGSAGFTLISANCVGSMLDDPRYAGLRAYSQPEGGVELSFGVSNYADPLLNSILNKAVATITEAQKTQLLIENMGSVPGRKPTLGEFANQYKAELFIAATVVLLIIVLAAVMYSIEIKRLNKRLEAEVKRADESSEAKSEFLSRMSHDIRTPMNGIMGLTRMAQDSKNVDEIHEYLSQLSGSSSYLLGILNDVLTMSKIDENKISLNPEYVKTKEFLSGILPIIRTQADEKGVVFESRCADDVPYQYFDSLRVEQIIVNLLNNAVKFTPRGGRVTYENSHETVDGRLLCRHVISDTGVGMSKKFMSTMFEPFSQETNAEKNTGTGLGLPICKKLVELMGGSISVKSALGEGSTFTVELPTRPATEEEYLAAHKACSDGVSKSVSLLAGARILLCEDNDVNIMVAEKLLDNIHCQVDSAKDGREGVKMFSASEPGTYSAVLMDIRMPVMDGLEAARAIRSLDRPDAKTVPIIAMSANAFDEDVKTSLEAGMNAHLSKPIDPQRLYDTLSEEIAPGKCGD